MGQPISTAAAQADRLEAVYTQVAALVSQPAVMERLRQGPGGEAWSVMQILGHMTEMIPYWLSHCQTMLAATDGLPKVGRALDAPERLEGVARGATATPEAILQQLAAEVRSASLAIRQMSEAERNKQGEHVRFGVVTVAQMLQVVIVNHAEEHLAQIRQALQGRGA